MSKTLPNKLLTFFLSEKSYFLIAPCPPMKYLWVLLVRRNAKMALVHIWDLFLGNFPKKKQIESVLFWICMLWHWNISFQEFKCEFKELPGTLDVLLRVTVVLYWPDLVLPYSLPSWYMLERPLGLPLVVFLLTLQEQVRHWCTVWGVLDPLGRLRNVLGMKMLRDLIEVFHYPGL